MTAIFAEATRYQECSDPPSVTISDYKKAFQYPKIKVAMFRLAFQSQQRRFVQLGRITPMKQQSKPVTKKAKPSAFRKKAEEAGYWLVIFGGVAVIGAMVWAVTEDFFKRDYSDEIYNEARQICIKDDNLRREMGPGPLTISIGLRGTTRNRLMTGYSMINGKKHLLVQFHASTPTKAAIVSAEARLKNNVYVLDYISVLLPEGRQVVIQDRKKIVRGRFGFY